MPQRRSSGPIFGGVTYYSVINYVKLLVLSVDFIKFQADSVGHAVNL